MGESWAGRAVAVAGVLGVFVWSAALFWSMEHASYDHWGALVVVGALVLLSVPLYRWAARADGQPGVLWLLWIALTAKLLATAARWYVTFALYDGQGDSVGYHNAGMQIADNLRSGTLVVPKEGFVSTRFVELATGVVYTVTGPTLIGGFLVFAWAALWGQWLFYRAYRMAFPDAPSRRYAVLVLLWPSLLFWPSSVGKESLMLLALGTATYGAARVYAGRLSGVVPLLLGTGLASAVRPHMALMIGAAVAAGVLVYRPRRRTSLTPMIRLGAFGACAVGVATLVSHATDYFATTQFDTSSLGSVATEAARRTTTGGSEFDAQPVGGLSDIPRAFMTVLFRPFPWEARNAVTLIAAAECLLLIALLTASWRRLLRVPRLALRVPLVVISLVFVLEFVVGFSVFGNFGILSRERSQVLPFVLLLSCLPLVLPDRRHIPSPDTVRRPVGASREGAIS